jgi:hypothetical protein
MLIGRRSAADLGAGPGERPLAGAILFAAGGFRRGNSQELPRRPARPLAVALILAIAAASCRPSRNDSPGHPTPPTKGSRPGSQLSPRLLTCQQGIRAEPGVTNAFDLVIGPLTYPRLLLGFSDDPPLTTPNYPGNGYFYKVGPDLDAGGIATVAIDAFASRYAGVVSSYSPDAGDQAITYHSCPQTRTGWVGGFVLRGRTTACVPIVVTIAGDPVVHRTVVSLGAGPCQQSG